MSFICNELLQHCDRNLTLVEERTSFWTFSSQDECSHLRIHACISVASTGDQDSQIQTSGASWYNSLQVTVQKRLSHGLEFQSAYTYAKTLDLPQGRLIIDGEALTPQAPRYVDRGRSVFDGTHNWRFNTLYALPTECLGVGLHAAERLVGAEYRFRADRIRVHAGSPGDVAVNALTSLQTGYERPDLVTSANIGDVTTCVGATGLTPLRRVCNPGAVVYDAASVITGNPNRWYNPNMFTTPLPGYLGNVGRGILTGPGLFNWDFSLHKNTPIRVRRGICNSGRSFSTS
jgi:hypothetical protein